MKTLPNCSPKGRTRDIRESLKLRSNILHRIKPTARYGAGVITWQRGNTRILLATWDADLTPPTGTIHLAYTYVSPFGDKRVNDDIRAVRIQAHRLWRWLFLCPSGKSYRCKKSTRILHLGSDGHFACHYCAGFEYACRRMRLHDVDDLVDNPEKIKAILSSPFIDSRKKMKALEALRRLRVRVRRAKIKAARMAAAKQPLAQ